MRCSICNVESEADAKFCRKCGISIHVSPKLSADDLASEHELLDGAVKPNSTSTIGVDFSNQKDAKPVVLLPKGKGQAAAGQRRRLLRRLQAKMFPVVAIILLLQLAVTGVMFFWIVKLKATPSLQSHPVQAQTSASDSSTQVPSVPPQVLNQSPPESTDTDVAAATNSAPNVLDDSIIEKQRLSDELDAKNDDKRRFGDRLDADIARKQHLSDNLDAVIAEKRREAKSINSEIDGLKGELVVLDSRHNKLRGEIDFATRTLKKSRYESALLERKKQEFIGLNRKIKVLNQAISQKQLVVKDLQKQITLMTNAHHGSRNRQMTWKR